MRTKRVLLAEDRAVETMAAGELGWSTELRLQHRVSAVTPRDNRICTHLPAISLATFPSAVVVCDATPLTPLITPLNSFLGLITEGAAA